MNRSKSNKKKERCIQHRKQKYEQALDKLIRGEASPEYVKERADKLKEVKG